MTRQATKLPQLPGRLGDELLLLLTDDIQTGRLCDKQQSYLSTGRLGVESLPLLTDDVETGGFRHDKQQRELPK